MVVVLYIGYSNDTTAAAAPAARSIIDTSSCTSRSETKVVVLSTTSSTTIESTTRTKTETTLASAASPSPPPQRRRRLCFARSDSRSLCSPTKQDVFNSNDHAAAALASSSQLSPLLPPDEKFLPKVDVKKTNNDDSVGADDDNDLSQDSSTDYEYEYENDPDENDNDESEYNDDDDDKYYTTLSRNGNVTVLIPKKGEGAAVSAANRIIIQHIDLRMMIAMDENQ
jgi:hypothetical protein